MKKVKGFDGHIILLCKNHYKYSSLIEGLRMIWAVRCGYEYKSEEVSVDRYIADRLYRLLQALIPDRIMYLQQRIHDEITYDWKFEPNSSFIERLIYIYCSEIAFMTVREKVGNEYRDIISLPEPMSEIFNRILKGEGKYEDYWLVEPK